MTAQLFTIRHGQHAQDVVVSAGSATGADTITLNVDFATMARGDVLRLLGEAGRRVGQGAWPFGAGGTPAPVNTVAPAFAGGPQAGVATVSTTGTWTDAASFTYNFRLDGTSAQNGASNSFTPAAPDAGKVLTYTVTATGPGGSTTSATITVGTVAAVGAQLPHLANLVAHWSADDITPVADGTAISSWTESINGVAATQATGAAQPTYQSNIFGGKPAVRFNGAKYLVALRSSATAMAAANDSKNYTTIVVACNVVAVANGTLFACNNSGADGQYLTATTGPRVGTFQRTVPFSGAGLAVIGQTSLVGASLGVPNGVQRHYINSSCFFEVTANPVVSTTADFGIGGRASAGQLKGNFNCLRILMWNRTLTPIEMLQVQKWVCDTYGQPYPMAAGPKYYAFQGDSLTNGFNASGAEFSYPYLVAASLGLTFGQWTNLGISSIDMPGMIANAPAEVDPLPAMTGCQVIVSGWEFYNGSTIAQARSWISGRRTANPTTAAMKIVFGTTSSAAANPVGRQAYNDAFDADHSDSDGYAAIHLNANIGVQGTHTNTTYFSGDQVHLTNAGYAELAGVFDPVIAAQ